jgi:hypothetical protein
MEAQHESASRRTAGAPAPLVRAAGCPAGLIVAWLMSDPTLLPRMVAYVPEPWRPVASVLVGFTAFALPTIARRLPQPPKTGDGQ